MSLDYGVTGLRAVVLVGPATRTIRRGNWQCNTKPSHPEASRTLDAEYNVVDNAIVDRFENEQLTRPPSCAHAQR